VRERVGHSGRKLDSLALRNSPRPVFTTKPKGALGIVLGKKRVAANGVRICRDPEGPSTVGNVREFGIQVRPIAMEPGQPERCLIVAKRRTLSAPLDFFLSALTATIAELREEPF
jgi:hypothetical protein